MAMWKRRGQPATDNFQRFKEAGGGSAALPGHVQIEGAIYAKAAIAYEEAERALDLIAHGQGGDPIQIARQVLIVMRGYW